jgi:DNA transformation protein
MSTTQEKQRAAELVEWVVESMEEAGAITSRAMMGGHTLYCDGVPFGIVARGEIWFKSNSETDAEWDAAACQKFTYDRDGKVATMNYRRAPDDVYDYPEELRRWAELGLVAGRSAAAKKKPKRSMVD